MTDSPDYSAKQLMDAAGMSYRQLNDWDQKGALPHDRSSERGWRRFSLNQIFSLMVCRAMQKRYGIPVERLKYVIKSMNREGENYLLWTAELMSALGIGAWLLTDLEDTFIIDTELELIDMMSNGYFRRDDPNGYLLLKVDPLVNLLLNRLGTEPIEKHGLGYSILRELELGAKLTPEELSVVREIRRGHYRSIEVVLADGEIRTIRMKESSSPDADIRSLIEEHDYQRISLVRMDGQVVSIERQITARPTHD